MLTEFNHIQNIIFLALDSLCYDRLGCNGYPLNVSPTIDYLAKNGIFCTNAFSYGPPTQFVLPSIFTSTFPLDFNGYDKGIKNRGRTLATILKSNGFKTMGFALGPWESRLNGYEKGFDEFYELFNIELFWINVRIVYYPYFEKLNNKQIIDDFEFCKIIKSLLYDYFTCMLNFCKEKQEEIKLGSFKYNHIIHRPNFELLHKLIAEKLDCLNQMPFHDLLEQIKQISSEDLYAFIDMPKIGIIKRIKKTFIKISRKILNMLYVQISRDNLGVNSEYIKNNIIDWIKRNSDKPFFIFSWLRDIHDSNCISGRIGLPPGYRELYGERLKLGKKYYGRLQYDFSVRYVDKNVGSIVDFLKQKGLLEKTLIVICGDHGASIAEISKRRLQNPIGSFRERFIKIPLIFYNPNLKPTIIQNLCTTLDIAPTILDLIGVDQIDDFKGSPVYSLKAKEREYVLLENLGAGPCDLDRKPILICIRTKRYKYIWREYTNDADKSSQDRVELYDLEKDPSERSSLISDGRHSNIANDLEKIAISRCCEIRNANKN